ncbi:RNA-binding protein 33 [Bienertia sinuspersici]
MDKVAKQRLYDKIRVGGANVIEALSFQCSMLYKHWRFRLKEQHFRNKSVAEAINSRPNTIDVNPWTWPHISKINTENKLKQTESPANGARSTARIFHDLLHEKEVEKHGEDTLSVKAAYMEAFKHKSGYVRELGPGARPPKKSRGGGENNEVRVELSAEIQQLKEDAATREASNDELKATISRINIEAIRCEKKLRDDMMKMLEQIRNNTGLC